MLYLISPSLTGVDNPQADDFVAAVVDSVGESQGCIVLSQKAQIDDLQSHLSAGDGIGVFATGGSVTVDEAVARLLKRAIDKDVPVLPIAIDSEHREGFYPITDRALFAVYDQRSARDLPQANLAPVARLYAWSLLAKTRPTFASPDVRVFISYARQHGEDLAASLDRELRAIGNSPIRDNSAYQHGQVVKLAIEESLAECDVLLLLDSREAQESEWVDWELRTAAKKGMPIVWVNCGAPAREESIHYIPGKVDIHVEREPDDVAELADLIDRAARQKLLIGVPDAHRFINRLDDWAEGVGGKISRLDPRLGLYEVTYPLPLSHYPTRPRTDVVQVFARQPRSADHESLVDRLQGDPFFAGRLHHRAFDAAVIAMATEGGQVFPDDGYAVAESAERYLENMERYGPTARPEDPLSAGLLLFGAFPKTSAATDQVMHASRNVTATWLRLGGAITFGGHPSITWNVIHAAAAAIGTESSHERVRVYQSELWPPQAMFDDIGQMATIIFVPAVPNDTTASLEAMRRRMIEDSDAIAAVIIGGRTNEEGKHRPGVRIEAAMARELGIPVFPLGATGGESSLLAAENQVAEASEQLNDANDKLNQMLATTDDYSGAAVAIWKATVG